MTTKMTAKKMTKQVKRKGFKRKDLYESKFFRVLIILAIVLVYIWAIFEALSVEISCDSMIYNYSVVKSKSDMAEGTWYEGVEGSGIIVNGITIPSGAASTLINIPHGLVNYFILEEDNTVTIARSISRRDGADLMFKSFVLSLVTLIVTIVTLTQVYKRNKWQKVAHWLLCVYQIAYVWFMLFIYGNAFICLFGVNADKFWMLGVLLSFALTIAALYGQFVEESDGRLQPQRKH